MFSLGLMSVILFGYNLFTGKAHQLRTKEIAAIDLATVWVGNLIGCFVAAFVAFWIGDQSVIEGARAIVESRVAAGPIKVFLLGVPTGLLMTAAIAIFCLTFILFVYINDNLCSQQYKHLRL